MNNKELTDKAFIPLPNLNCDLAYKTGDLAKWDNNGIINFIGRNDFQVKINGHRIELEEIEKCVYSYSNISKVVVLVNSDNKIICFFTASSQIDIENLKSFMQRKLPEYFIPNFFMQLDKFELTANGKIDREALKRIDFNTTVSTNNYEAPKTIYQKTLVGIFEDILGKKDIGITDNFFELGGDSLLAIKLQVETFNRGLDLNYKDIFKYPTIKELSENVSAVENQDIFNDEYDYSKIDKLLKNNSFNERIKLSKNKFKNILLTGATGFMGSHILDALLKNTKCKIYCLIRFKNDHDPQIRLLNKLRFYFGNKYDKEMLKRIIVLEGDIQKEYLGLKPEVYKNLGKSVDCVINSAAIVKHYGNNDIFNSINVLGTKNVIKFCNNFNCKLFHLSTLSVSGNLFETDSVKAINLEKDILFTEQTLYVEQELSNVYVHTKFIAERLILENILNGKIDAKIIRLGNITNRFSDGVFQINVNENAFLKRMHSFLHIGCIPDYLENNYIEFSPVDLCANAVVKLILSDNDFTVYHVYNNNHISIKKLVKILNNLNIPIKLVSKEEFDERINSISKDLETKHIISGIINDFDKDKVLNYNTDIKIQNNFTNKLLRKLYFRWPVLNERYFRKYIIYLKTIGYIK